MRTAVFLLVACIFLTTALTAQETVSALGALRLLPKSDMKNIARIEARDGTPVPERWYLIVNDPSDPNGLHEFVVAGKEIVASRALSQFVETVKPEEIMGLDTLKIDSDRAAKLAKEYAAANNIAVRSLNYELKREGAEAAPAWKISCLDESGSDVAELTLTATKGTVVSHVGFESAPQPAPEKKKRLAVYAEPEVATPKPHKERRVEEKPESPVVEKPGVIGQTIQNVGNTFKHFFTGHD